MRVKRVRMPVTDAESWTVLHDDCRSEPAIEQYLAHLAALERSPNTVRAYATSLKLWFEFLAQVDVGWDEAGVDDVARFVSWPRAPTSNVIVLEKSSSAHAGVATSPACSSGSVSTKCAQHSRCPVVIVPKDDESARAVGAT
jgi:hypothetical protein